MHFNVSGNDILHGNIIRGMLIMSVPLMLLNLINTAYALVDTFFVGKISELAVGAVSLVAPILSCGIALIILLNPKEPVRLTKDMFKTDRRLVLKIFQVSLPAAAGQFLASFGFVLMSKDIVSYGSIILSACRLFAVRIPVIYLLAKYTNLQHLGIWTAMVISNLIICISGQIIYRVYSWDKKGIRI